MKSFFKVVVVLCLSLFVFCELPLAQAAVKDVNTKDEPNKIWIDVKVEKEQGWQRKFDNQDAGSTGRGRRLEAIRMGLYDKNKKIAYQIYSADKGWSDWKYDGEVADNTGAPAPISGIRIKVMDRVNDALVDVEYRVHMEMNGWVPYVKCNEQAGNLAFRIEAITVRFPDKSEGGKGINDFF